MLLTARSETGGAVTYARTVNVVVQKVSNSLQTNALVKTSMNAVVEMVVVIRCVSINKVHTSARANPATPLNLMAKFAQILTNVLATQTSASTCVRIQKEATGVPVWRDLLWLTINANMIAHLTSQYLCVHLVYVAGNIVQPIVMPNVSLTFVVGVTPDSITKELGRRSIAILIAEKCVKINRQCVKYGNENDTVNVSRISCRKNVLINADSATEAENMWDQRLLWQNRLLDQNLQLLDQWMEHGAIGVLSVVAQRNVVAVWKPADECVTAPNPGQVEGYVLVKVSNTGDVTRRNAHQNQHNQDRRQQQPQEEEQHTVTLEDLLEEEHKDQHKDLRVDKQRLAERKLLAQRKTIVCVNLTLVARPHIAVEADGLREIAQKCVVFVLHHLQQLELLQRFQLEPPLP